MKCVSCHVINETVKQCEVCQLYSFCDECRVVENHTGSFICTKCNKEKCNTYQEKNDTCWSCTCYQLSTSINSLTDHFKKVNPELGEMFEGMHNEITGLIEKVKETNPQI